MKDSTGRSVIFFGPPVQGWPTGDEPKDTDDWFYCHCDEPQPDGPVCTKCNKPVIT